MTSLAESLPQEIVDSILEHLIELLKVDPLYLWTEIRPLSRHCKRVVERTTRGFWLQHLELHVSTRSNVEEEECDFLRYKRHWAFEKDPYDHERAYFSCFVPCENSGLAYYQQSVTISILEDIQKEYEQDPGSLRIKLGGWVDTNLGFCIRDGYLSSSPTCSKTKFAADNDRYVELNMDPIFNEIKLKSGFWVSYNVPDVWGLSLGFNWIPVVEAYFLLKDATQFVEVDMEVRCKTQAPKKTFWRKRIQQWFARKENMPKNKASYQRFKVMGSKLSSRSAFPIICHWPLIKAQITSTSHLCKIGLEYCPAFLLEDHNDTEILSIP
jgi:hypothetical protein